MIRRIHFDDSFYLTVFSFVISLCSLVILSLFINKLPIWGCVILIISFSLFLAGTYMFFRMGISFNYKTKRVYYFGHYKIKRSSFSMNEISEIKFCEIPTPRSNDLLPPKDYIVFNQCDSLEYVYRNGKIFKITFLLTNGEMVEIPYFYLFKSFSAGRVKKQEIRINKIIEEFNSFSLETRNK
mgnify:CR=1 FL=1